MRKGLAIYGASEEALALVPVLEDNAEVEVVGVYASDPEAARRLAKRMRVAVEISDDAKFGASRAAWTMRLCSGVEKAKPTAPETKMVTAIGIGS